jgi:uncharacterized protein with HEPN domain
MLREPKNDLIHLLGILESASKVAEYAEGFSTADEFLHANHEMNYNASLTLIAVIGESIGKLSDLATEALTDLPLRRIRGMRNRIVHDYVGVDSQIVFDTITMDLWLLKARVQGFLEKQIQAGVFDPEELKVVRESHYYPRVTI